MTRGVTTTERPVEFDPRQTKPDGFHERKIHSSGRLCCRHRAIGAVGRFVQEALPNQLLETQLAGRHIDLPQPRCLQERQPHPGHFAVFTANTSDKRIKMT
jgi:hypothetical protein